MHKCRDLLSRKIMISKLVVATYITSKAAFFLQPNITHPYHISYNKWYSSLGLSYNISFLCTSYNKIKHELSRTSLRRLEVVEVAHRRGTAGRRVVRLRVRLSKCVLRIYIRNSLYLLGVLIC